MIIKETNQTTSLRHDTSNHHFHWIKLYIQNDDYYSLSNTKTSIFPWTCIPLLINHLYATKSQINHSKPTHTTTNLPLANPSTPRSSTQLHITIPPKPKFHHIHLHRHLIKSISKPESLTIALKLNQYSLQSLSPATSQQTKNVFLCTMLRKYKIE